MSRHLLLVPSALFVALPETFSDGIDQPGCQSLFGKRARSLRSLP